MLSAVVKYPQGHHAIKRFGVRAQIAIARGINRTATSERAAMSSGIAGDMGIKVGTAREAIGIEKATTYNLRARLTARGKRLPLVDFKARGPEPSRGKGAGVSAKLPGGAGRYPRAFIATMKSGHRGVFQRTSKARLGIYELFGPSIVRVFEKFIPIGAARRNEVLQKNVQHELDFALTRAS